MAKYQPDVSEHSRSGLFHALVVFVNSDGCKLVDHGYEGRYFKTQKAALKSTGDYISNLG